MKTPTPKAAPNFKRVINAAKDATDGVEFDGYPGKDIEHHVFEAVMEAVYGKGFWKWWNEKVRRS